MCGGIIEAGLIAAAVGFIGKKIHKCKCKCHDEQENCKHCADDIKNKIKNHEHKKHYSFLQKVFIILSILGILGVGIGVGISLKHFTHEHTINCKH
jgi:hypothetical protein